MIDWLIDWLIDWRKHFSVNLICFKITLTDWFYNRVGFFLQELNANEKRVGVVNDLGGQLIEKGHINSDEIKDTIDGLNTK